jgi:hypothetical protein
MRKSTTAALGVLGMIAGGLLAGGAAFAQDTQVQHGRVIQIPPGAVVLVLPAGTPIQSLPSFNAAFPFAAMPSPTTMVREVQQMMANAERAFANPAWTVGNGAFDVAMPQGSGPYSSVVVTSVSDSHGTCTQRITYAGNGAAPKVEVRSTGDACAHAGMGAGMPISSPDVKAPQPRSLPHTVTADSHASLAPLQVAQLNN